MSSRRQLLGGAGLLFASALTMPLASGAIAQAGKFPRKPVLLVAPGTIGGGADVLARLTADAIEKSNALDEPIAVLNRPAGVEIYSFIKSKSADPHYLFTVTNLFLTYPMLGPTNYQYSEFTPIANLVFDPAVVVVNAESPYKTLKDLVEATKQKPNTITMGGGQVGTQDHLAYLTLRKASGLDARFVGFAGGGEVHRNLLGNQIESAIGNPSDFLASVEAGKLRILAIMDEQRNPAPGLKDVATAKEQGYGANFVVFRGFAAPPKIPEADRSAVIDLFRKVMDDKNFQEKYVLRFGMRPAFMAGDEFSKFLKDREIEYRELLVSAGVVKQ